MLFDTAKLVKIFRKVKLLVIFWLEMLKNE